MTRKSKVALIVNDTFSAWIFRKGLIRALVNDSRWDVVVIAPEDKKYSDLLETIGARHIVLPLKRFVSPFSDIITCLLLFRILKRERPNVVHTFTIKPNIYGTIMAKIAGIKTVNCSVTGLGYFYSEEASLRYRICRLMVIPLYRIACRLCDRFSFQNGDDLKYFVENKYLIPAKAVLIRSSGVDLNEFSLDHAEPEKVAREHNVSRDEWVVLMVARAIWSKGVKEFIEASEAVSAYNRKARFLLIGGLEDGPNAVPQSYLESRHSPNFEWVGFRTNIRDYMARADVVVLPSYYAEGIPRCLLEAMALAKPIVTTDSVGCREVIEDERNGYTVPIKDVNALSEAIIKIITNPEQMLKFGQRSREKVEEEFCEKLVVRQTLRHLYGLEAVAI